MPEGTRNDFHGPESLVEAIDVVLNDNNVHVVLINGFVRAHQARQLILPDVRNHERLYEAVPQLQEADTFVAEWWKTHGYKDYRLMGVGAKNLFLSMAKRGPSEAHVDVGRDGGRLLYGPLIGSIGASRRQALWYATKPKVATKTSANTFDPTKFQELREDSEWGLSDLDFMPHGPVVQKLGDLVLTTNHPWPAKHQVEAHPHRRARLVNYFIELASGPAHDPVDLLQRAA